MFFAAGRGRYADQIYICLKRGLIKGSFYKWLSNYSGMDVCETKRSLVHELQNGKQKQLLSEAFLNIYALKCVFGEKA